MTHEDLIQRVALGNEQAFTLLVDLYQDRVYNTCFGYLQNAMESQDVAQEVFLEIHRSAKKFKRNASVSTWIYRIAVNKSLDTIRYQKREKRSGDELAIDDPSVQVKDKTRNPEEALVRAERHELLWRLIKQLPEAQQTALVLCNFEGLSYHEISEVMEGSKNSVESLIFRAKQNLKKLLTTHYKTIY
jgi:RNA polymerase sigma factor (sigma-70 family)